MAEIAVAAFGAVPNYEQRYKFLDETRKCYVREYMIIIQRFGLFIVVLITAAVMVPSREYSKIVGNRKLIRHREEKKF